MAARVVHVGAGEIVPIKRLNVSNLKAAVDRVFYNECFRLNVSKLSSAIQAAGGGRYAINIIEKAMVVYEARNSKQILR